MKLSVVIVTYGRPDDCREAVESLIHMDKLPDEIVVVDDHPTKHFKYSHPLVNIIQTSEEKGLSGCRNIGVMNSGGDIIAFLDDDVIVDRGWAENVINCFRDEKLGIVFGRIDPLYMSPPPKWWDEKKFGWTVGVCVPAGANFAVRREVFDKVGLFNEFLGIRKGIRVSLEEYEFSKRCSKYYEIGLCDKAVIKHKVPAKRLTRKYVLKRCFSEGRGKRRIGERRAKDLVKGVAYHLARIYRMDGLCGLAIWLGYLFG